MVGDDDDDDDDDSAGPESELSAGGVWVGSGSAGGSSCSDTHYGFTWAKTLAEDCRLARLCLSLGRHGCGRVSKRGACHVLFLCHVINRL